MHPRDVNEAAVSDSDDVLDLEVNSSDEDDSDVEQFASALCVLPADAEIPELRKVSLHAMEIRSVTNVYCNTC